MRNKRRSYTGLMSLALPNGSDDRTIRAPSGRRSIHPWPLLKEHLATSDGISEFHRSLLEIAALEDPKTLKH